MSDDLARIGFAADTRDLTRAERSLTSLATTGSRTERSINGSVRSVNGAFTSLRSTIGLVGAALAAMGISKLTSELVTYSEEWKNVNNSLRIVMDSEEQLISTRSRLFILSKETNSQLSATSDLYSELFRSSSDLNVSEDDLFKTTRALNNLFAVGGKDLNTRTGAIRQLSQALGAGALRGDEFNSVIEAAPRILDALATKLNISKGEMRDFAATGGITAEILIGALSDYSSVAQGLADKTDKMWSQFITNAETNAIRFVGTSKGLADAITTVGSGVESLSEDIQSIVDAGQAFISVVGIGMAGALAKSTAATIAQSVATISATRANATRLTSEVALLQSQRANFAASLAGASSENIRNTFRLRLTATTASLTAAELSLSAANMAVARTASAAALSTTALGVASRFLLGPWGLLITAVGVAATVFTSSKNESNLLNESLSTQEEAVRKLTKEYKDNSAAQLQSTIFKTAGAQVDLMIEQFRLQKEINKVGFNPFSETAQKLESDLLTVNSKLDDLGVRSAAARNSLDTLFAAGMKNIEWTNEKIEVDKKAAAEAERLKNANKEYAKWLATITGFRTPLQGVTDEIGMINQAIIDGLPVTDNVINKLAELSGKLANLSNKTSELNEVSRDTGFQDFIESITGSTKSGQIAGLTQEIELIQDLLSFDGIDEGVGSEAIKSIEDQIKSLKNTVDKVDVFGGMTDSIGTALQAMKGFTEEGSKEQAKLQVAIAATNAVAAIGAVINQSQGDPYTAFGRMAAMAAAMAALGQSVGGLGGSNGDSSVQNQADQGLNIWGDKSESIANSIDITADATDKLVGINTGMLKALQSLQAGISGAAGISARGVSDAKFGFSPDATKNPFSGANKVAKFSDRTITGGIGDIIDKSLGGMISSLNEGSQKILGGSSKVTDSGIKVIGGAITDIIDGAVVFAFQETKTKKYSWSSSKRHEELQAMDEASNQFGLVFSSIADSVFQGATSLGLSSKSVEDAINKFQVATVKISLKGLGVDEQQAEIEAVFSQLFDNLTGNVIPFIDKFQQAGEGLGETLSRVATQVSIADFGVKNLGIELGDKLANPEMYARISDNLSMMTGGIENFASKTASFVDDFAPDSVKFTIASDALTEQLNAVGLAVPATSEAFFALMKGINGTTAAGQEQITTLLNSQDVAKDYFSFVDDYTDSLTQLSKTLRGAVVSIFDADIAASKLSLDAALQAARIGDFSKALSLDLSNLTPDASDFGTLQAFNIEQAKAANKIAELADLTAGTASIQDMTLTANQEQVNLLASINENINTAYVPQQTAVQNNDSMIIELKEVKEALKSMQAANQATETNTKKSADSLQRIEMGGVEIRA